MNMFGSYGIIRPINPIDKNFYGFFRMFIVLFTLCGSPNIYYGIEVALEDDCDKHGCKKYEFEVYAQFKQPFCDI